MVIEVSPSSIRERDIERQFEERKEAQAPQAGPPAPQIEPRMQLAEMPIDNQRRERRATMPAAEAEPHPQEVELAVRRRPGRPRKGEESRRDERTPSYQQNRYALRSSKADQ